MIQLYLFICFILSNDVQIRRQFHSMTNTKFLKRVCVKKMKYYCPMSILFSVVWKLVRLLESATDRCKRVFIPFEIIILNESKLSQFLYNAFHRDFIDFYVYSEFFSSFVSVTNEMKIVSNLSQKCESK